MLEDSHYLILRTIIQLQQSRRYGIGTGTETPIGGTEQSSEQTPTNRTIRSLTTYRGH